jgi:putative two-component system response regulator
MNKKIILAVDDMPENLTNIRSILQDKYDVRLAKTPSMGLSLLNIVPVDLILLDIEMPHMTGLQFLQQLRINQQVSHPDRKPIPVIFVTAHASTDIITRAVTLGGKDYIVKPVKPEVLLKKIEAVFNPAESQDATPLEITLGKLHEAVIAGDSREAEKLTAELLAFTQHSTAVRARAETIKNLVSRFDYELALEKIEGLFTILKSGAS